MNWTALGCLGFSACVLIGYDELKSDAAVSFDAALVVDSGEPAADGTTTPAPAALDCPTDAWCIYRCGGDLGDCSFTCKSGEFCRIECAGPTGCAGVKCERDATCAMYCPNSDGQNCGGECSESASSCAALNADAWCGSCTALPAM